MRFSWLILLALSVVAGDVRADSLADVREWPDNRLPIASNWNCGGFPFDWHVEQIRAGNWFLPTTKIGLVPKNPSVGSGQKLTAENEVFLREGGFPLSLRSENLANIFTAVLPRLPADRIAESALVWKLDAAGHLEDEAIADMLGPVEPWRLAGETWGKSAILTDLQTRFPNASRLILADNNESAVDKPARYMEAEEDRQHYPDKIYAWPSLEKLGTLNVRVRDYAASGRTPAEFFRDFETRRSEKYNALKSALSDASGPWRGRLMLESYDVPVFRNDWPDIGPQYSPQFGHVDAGGGTLYPPKGKLGDFTSPEWFRVYLANAVHARAETINPRHVREVIVNLSGGGVIAGYQAGRHEPIGRERYAAHLQWLLWSSKGTQTPVHLRYWTNNAKTPATLLFSSDEGKATVTEAGSPELASATEEMPVSAAMEAVNRINGDPILRRFWLEGQPISTGTHPENEIRYFHYNEARVYPQPDEPDDGFRLLECDLNTPRDQWIKQPSTNTRGGWNPDVSIKIWGTATRIGDECLVHLWSPCKLDGQCRVTVPDFGTFDVDVPQPEAYYLIQSKPTIERVQ